MSDRNETFGKLISSAKDDELWLFYGLVESEMRKRGHLRSRNVTAERGEMVALQIYNSIPNEPKLQLTPSGTKNVDAISRHGERYAIKAVKSTTMATGTFQADDFSQQRFEHLIIVVLNEMYQPVGIFEASWAVVNKHKRYDKTMKAYKVSLTRKFLNECRIVYPKQK
jgi:hypothetical protein